jgi:hypothetical protein
VTVLHACRDSVHVDVGGRAVGVGARTAPGLPHCLRTSLVGVTTGDVPNPYLEDGILHLGGRALLTGRLVDVRAPRLDAARVLKTSPAGHQGSPRPRPAGLVALPARVTPETVPAFVGRGDGLTPLGDDVLGGWLAVHRAAGLATPAVDDAVRRSLGRTTTLSATLLDCALQGETPDLVAAVLRAWGTPAEASARTRLSGLGHSSGAGLLHGMDLAFADLAGRAAA